MSKLLENTLRADTLAENGAWIRACGVAHLQRGELETYAKQKGRTRQAISRWVAAWTMYDLMRLWWWAWPEKFGVFPHPLIMRSEPSVNHYTLGLEHFVEIGEWFRKHEPEPYEVFWHLFTAWEQGVDAKAMRVQLDELATPNGTPEWYRRASGVMADLGKLRTDYGAPEEVKLLAGMTYEALKEWMELGIQK